jgi:pimeloyl-ACP methyl ester carboxylesterase
MIAKPEPLERGLAISADARRIAWYRYGMGDRAILFVPTWNLVDARVVGHQVAALLPHAAVVTYDPRGAGASDRPAHGYDFSMHAADAMAVLLATGIERAAVVTASRGFNAALLLAAEHPERVERIAVVGPYMRLEPEPAQPDSARLEAVRTDWAGFIVPFMHTVFSEPGSDELIEEMIGIGMEASPEAIATQETELDWRRPAALLGTISQPTLIVHGDADAAVPVSLARQIAAAMPNARLHVVRGGGHRPDIRSPDRVNALLAEFLLGDSR